MLSRCAMVPIWLATIACAAGAHNAQPEPKSSEPAKFDETALVAQLCHTSACAGPMSVISVYRKPGAPHSAIYVHEGDISVCSHPPWSYFDQAGKQVLSQGEHPIASAEEGRRYQAERDQVLSGRVKSEELRCATLPHDAP